MSTSSSSRQARIWASGTGPCGPEMGPTAADSTSGTLDGADECRPPVRTPTEFVTRPRSGRCRWGAPYGARAHLPPGRPARGRTVDLATPAAIAPPDSNSQGLTEVRAVHRGCPSVSCGRSIDLSPSQISAVLGTPALRGTVTRQDLGTGRPLRLRAPCRRATRERESRLVRRRYESRHRFGRSLRSFRSSHTTR